eukprot:COSAG04_NODE_1268_length_7478_cov_41.075620_2_plen_472_part_01
MERSAVDLGGMLAATVAAVGMLQCASPSLATKAKGAPSQAGNAHLAAELARKGRLSELTRRARAAGATEQSIEDARDADDPKSAMAALVLAREARAGGAQPAPGLQQLREELGRLKLSALEARAAAAGATEEDIEAAVDEDDPKPALIDLILRAQPAAAAGPAARLLSALQAGEETAADALTGVLDHAMEVLEQQSMASPRKSRKEVRALLDRVESAAESIDAAWCDGVSETAGSVEELSRLLAAVEGLDAASGVLPDAVSCVSALLDCLDRCGSVVLRSLSILCGGSGGADARLGALEALRGLSEARQSEITDEEVSAFGCVKDMVGSLDATSDHEVCVSGCMALHTLGCRIGLTVCATEEMVGAVTHMVLASTEPLRSLRRNGHQNVTCAAHALANLIWSEAPLKTAPEVRKPLETRVVQGTTAVLGMTGQFDLQRIANAACLVVQSGALAGHDLSLSCGAAFLLHNLLY